MSDYALEVSPDTSLQFVLTRTDGNADPKSDGTARCVMTLKHPGKSNNHIAFKVKTTQPRRYLVRPNQGIVAPGSTESVTILLVEKDKQMLLQSFDRLGQSALYHSKDKFLVQSCTVDEAFAISYSQKKRELDSISDTDKNGQVASKVGKELAESLTGMWNEASNLANDGEGVPIYNKKLQVRHTVATSKATSATRSGGVRQDQPKLENMTSDQMLAEITSLRRKYDELVTFSVNLTAERDILNNTLEQTKRDLNREIARAKENRVGGGAASGGTQTIANSKSGSGFMSFLFFIFVGALFFLIGVKAKHLGAVEFLYDIPILGDALHAEL